MPTAETDTRESAITIVGAGPVGMALALALRRAGIDCRLLDAREPGAARGDRRVLAVSHGSRQILEWLGVWTQVPATPIETIHISQQGGFGRTRIVARDYGLPALGYVVTAAALASALGRALAAQGVPIDYRIHVESMTADAAEALVDCRSESAVHPLRTRLVAFAEGGVQATDDAITRSYEQTAVICTARSAAPCHGVAYERFTAHGPLAMLPHGADEYAVVLVTAPDQAGHLADLGDAQFLDQLQQRFGERVRFTAVSPRATYPLTLRFRRQPVGIRCVYLGNSAQTLHPVAGQGLNLALRDVWALARVLGEQDVTDAGAAQVLERYAGARRLDRGGAIGFTDSLIRIFSNESSALQVLRGGGLMLLDLLPPARDFVAKRMIFGARAWP